MADASPLVSTQWLAVRRSDPTLRIVDIRSAVDGGARAAFERAHVPGAVHTDYAKDGWRATRGMATGLLSLMLIRGIMGIAEGAVAPTGVAVAVEASHPTRRGMNNGIFQCTISLFGNGFGPIIATQLLLFTTWRTVFWIVGIPGLIVAIIMWFVVREPLKRADTGHGTGGAPFMSMFGHRNAKVAPLTLICAMGGIFVLAAMLTAYLTAPVPAGLGLDAVTASSPRPLPGESGGAVR